MGDIVVYFSYFVCGLIVWEIGGNGFLLVFIGERVYLSMRYSSSTYGVIGLIRGRRGGGGPFSGSSKPYLLFFAPFCAHRSNSISLFILHLLPISINWSQVLLHIDIEHNLYYFL